ncbi:proprotein convertase subtilisin/kexin type 9-like [Saccoglossus kowalevskii]|uniref:Proprotein convertase subtilisin/kexin type 9-like n=1 Tax=Saccoglossus kowalevskii TaxID=10224 RepID=A0ABM0GWU2_SACKO|nr:PREDICTED: proprotein convertase subtilisin/kexin type 9-like [Saccoglossus kowalevskii]
MYTNAFLFTVFLLVTSAGDASVISVQTCDVCDLYDVSATTADTVARISENIDLIRNEIGQLKSKECATNIQPVCTTRQGLVSNTGDDDPSQVTCLEDEVMTGCSSLLQGGGHDSRDGEKIVFSVQGRATCVAYNGVGGAGVRAFARCCTWPDMTCYYPKSEKSERQDDAIAETVCDHWFNRRPTIPTGCMAYTPWTCIDGARPVGDQSEETTSPITRNACQAINGYCGAGVYSYAACCSAPDLECGVKYSTKSGVDIGDIAEVWCDEGWTLTGCNSYTAWVGNHGAYIEDDTCKAVNGNGGGTWAVATCCRGQHH